jgi:coenzyme F420-reducing hydrogenase gamma subunit
MGYSAQKISYKRLLEELRNARGMGQYLKYLDRLATCRVLLLDDFGIGVLTAEECAAACPSSPTDCESPRVWTEICVTPSPLAGCAEAVMGCGKPCEHGDDCANEFFAQCWSGLCQVWSPF